MSFIKSLCMASCMILGISMNAQNPLNQTSASSDKSAAFTNNSERESTSEPGQGFSVPAGTIEVSKNLYFTILDWILKGKEITLENYLFSNYENAAEVRHFLKQYYSGPSGSNVGSEKGKNSSGSGGSGTTSNMDECTCKNIMPTDKASATILPAFSDDDILDSDWNGQYHAWWYWKGDGCAHDFTMDGSGNDIWEGDNQERNGYYQKIEILNLCSEEGTRSETCNCDKVMYTDGEYFKRYHLYTDEAGLAEIEAKLMESFYAFTAERDVLVDRNKFINTDEIASASIEMGASISRSIDWVS